MGEWWSAVKEERLGGVRNRAANAALEYTGIALLVLTVVVLVWRFLLPAITCSGGSVKEQAGATAIVDTLTGAVTTAAPVTSAAC